MTKILSFVVLLGITSKTASLLKPDELAAVCRTLTTVKRIFYGFVSKQSSHSCKQWRKVNLFIMLSKAMPIT